MLGWLTTSFSSTRIKQRHSSLEQMHRERNWPLNGSHWDVLPKPDLKPRCHPIWPLIHIRNVTKVRPFLYQANTEKLVQGFITSRLDYCNTVLSGLSKKSHRLKFSCSWTRMTAHITHALKSIIFYDSFISLNGLGPDDLSDVVLRYVPTRSLRSSGSCLFVVSNFDFLSIIFLTLIFSCIVLYFIHLNVFF